MKTFLLIFIHLVSAVILFVGSCIHPARQAKIKGDWHTKNGSTRLKITADKFTEDNGSPVTEDYFMKGDTIFTSFEGNQPFTKYIVLKVDSHNLTLLDPDADSISYVK